MYEPERGSVTVKSVIEILRRMIRPCKSIMAKCLSGVAPEMYNVRPCVCNVNCGRGPASITFEPFSLELDTAFLLELDTTLLELDVVADELDFTMLELDCATLELDFFALELDAATLELDFTMLELDCFALELDCFALELEATMLELDFIVLELETAMLELETTIEDDELLGKTLTLSYFA